MKKRFSITEARVQLGRIVDLVASGREIEVTRRGKPVAVLKSCPVAEPAVSFSEAYEQFLPKYPLDEWGGIDDDFVQSLRSRDPGRKVTL